MLPGQSLLLSGQSPSCGGSLRNPFLGFSSRADGNFRPATPSAPGSPTASSVTSVAPIRTLNSTSPFAAQHKSTLLEGFEAEMERLKSNFAIGVDDGASLSSTTDFERRRAASASVDQGGHQHLDLDRRGTLQTGGGGLAQLDETTAAVAGRTSTPGLDFRPFKASDYFTDFKMPTTPFGGIAASAAATAAAAVASDLPAASLPPPAAIPMSMPVMPPPLMSSTFIAAGGVGGVSLAPYTTTGTTTTSSPGNVIAHMSSEMDKLRIANFSLEQAVQAERASVDTKAQQMAVHERERMLSEHADHNLKLQDCMAQYRKECDDKVSAAQEEKDREVEALKESHRSQQVNTEDRLKKVNESYCAQIADLHRLLNKEGQQLQAARQDVQAMQSETSQQKEGAANHIMELSKTISQLQERLSSTKEAGDEAFNNAKAEFSMRLEVLSKQQDLQRQNWSSELKNSIAREKQLEVMLASQALHKSSSATFVPQYSSTLGPTGAVGMSVASPVGRSVYVSPASTSSASVNRGHQISGHETVALHQSLSNAHKVSEHQLKENRDLIEMVQQLQSENSMLRDK